MKYLPLPTNKSISRLLTLSLMSSVLLLTACGGSSDDDEHDHQHETSLDLPNGKKLIFVDASSPKQYLYDTDTETKTDLNADPAKNYYLGNSTEIGHFFFWLDEHNDSEQEKIVMLNNSYTKGNAIASTDFLYLAHYHGDNFAAHKNTEFANLVAGSAKYAGLARLNAYATEQADLFNEISVAFTNDSKTTGQQICQTFVDPHAEHAGHGSSSSAEPVPHLALSKTGHIYLYKENTAGELVNMQDTFVFLTGVSNITDCNRVTITRASDDGVLVFVADTQKLYLVDTHGSDFHLHSSWSIADFMPTGFIADYMGAIGEGEEDDHH